MRVILDKKARKIGKKLILLNTQKSRAEKRSVSLSGIEIKLTRF